MKQTRDMNLGIPECSQNHENIHEEKWQIVPGAISDNLPRPKRSLRRLITCNKISCVSGCWFWVFLVLLDMLASTNPLPLNKHLSP